jgi:hypothetical protein
MKKIEFNELDSLFGSAANILKNKNTKNPKYKKGAIVKTPRINAFRLVIFASPFLRKAALRSKAALPVLF